MGGSGFLLLKLKYIYLLIVDLNGHPRIYSFIAKLSIGYTKWEITSKSNFYCED